MAGSNNLFICNTFFIFVFIIRSHLPKRISNSHSSLHQQGELHDQSRIVHHQFFISFRSGFLLFSRNYNNHDKCCCKENCCQHVSGSIIRYFPLQFSSFPVRWKIIILRVFQFAVIICYKFQKLLFFSFLFRQHFLLPSIFLFQFFFRDLYIDTACFFSFHGYHKFFFISIFLLFQLITVFKYLSATFCPSQQSSCYISCQSNHKKHLSAFYRTNVFYMDPT